MCPPNNINNVFPLLSNIILIDLLLVLISFGHGSSSDPSPLCPPSSCGKIKNITHPFRLKTDPPHCGSRYSWFQLDCKNNHTVFTVRSPRGDAKSGMSARTYFVQNINYTDQTIRIVESRINTGNLSSCPVITDRRWGLRTDFNGFSIVNTTINARVAFIHCLSPVNSPKYLKAPFCGDDTINVFGNSSDLHAYVTVGHHGLFVSDLEDSCMVDLVGRASTRGPIMNISSLLNIYEGLAFGFEFYWFDVDKVCGRRRFRFSLVPKDFMPKECCYLQPNSIAWKIAFTIVWALAEIFAIRLVVGFLIGFSLLVWFVVHKWRRRHLSADKSIEEFLQDQHNFAPIKYAYSEIKKMTNSFQQKLGEGGYGSVYKGKLRSGPYVAIKMMDQTISREEEFISEVGTIGCIHHVNIVQLIGFCVEHSKYALVYEFLPNGSLDRYIFSQESLGITLTCDKIFEIALGVARGIGYLHHGCDMQILHFDIKPHNILLDENFNPKISDFGLARLHSTNESFIRLTDARGTMGYMAPEMFYRNMGGISYKADIYSFGMMLMEMAGRRKNLNHFVEDQSQICFPSWVYDQLCAGKDIEINDASDEETRIVTRIMIVALWCIQMRPSNRPPIRKVVEMLESESQPSMPPNPFATLNEIADDEHGITPTYSVDYINLDFGEI
ncbi:rust resistance kinase Lr10-like isoform X2 [Andrographis paniculata]|uniref:rust resistance kinase Lr10-like isoform X2 n=1 Tax=Andrographis paniculata TaxID=175694 RepID=UPI0021E8DCEE|nr:rust resistance kinase Lr10-like isoform X2 [Andrographis paniculata]